MCAPIVVLLISIFLLLDSNIHQLTIFSYPLKYALDLNQLFLN